MADQAASRSAASWLTARLCSIHASSETTLIKRGSRGSACGSRLLCPSDITSGIARSSCQRRKALGVRPATMPRSHAWVSSASSENAFGISKSREAASPARRSCRSSLRRSARESEARSSRQPTSKDGQRRRASRMVGMRSTSPARSVSVPARKTRTRSESKRLPWAVIFPSGGRKLSQLFSMCRAPMLPHISGDSSSVETKTWGRARRRNPRRRLSMTGKTEASAPRRRWPALRPGSTM